MSNQERARHREAPAPLDCVSTIAARDAARKGFFAVPATPDAFLSWETSGMGDERDEDLSRLLDPDFDEWGYPVERLLPVDLRVLADEAD